MDIIPVTQAKKQLLSLVRQAQEQGKAFRLTRKGAPAAVLLSEEEYRSVKETLEVLNDPEELRGILEGRADIAAGRTEELEALLERLEG
jgi:prevent-host-death family protein